MLPDTSEKLYIFTSDTTPRLPDWAVCCQQRLMLLQYYAADEGLKGNIGRRFVIAGDVMTWTLTLSTPLEWVSVDL